jgi:adenylosuccinate synthase
VNKPTLEVVVGAQFGSEAKGHVVQRLTERAVSEGRYPHVVRVAGPNAGHTGYDRAGGRWALRQVPVAAVVEGHMTLGIAPGSEVDPPVLLDEIDRLTEAGLMQDKVLWVSGMATIITDEHRIAEGDAALVAQIGSTGKGIGAARADRIMRKAELVRDNWNLINELGKRHVAVASANAQPLRALAPSRVHAIIEGTQGYGLGLHTEYYPKCTSSNCRAIDFMAMAGVNPWEFDKVKIWAVARVFPIRVAGNSGPLKDETTWEALGLPEEKTTVTQKVRRVGGPDWDLVREAVIANGGSPTVEVALTMIDQMFPGARDRRAHDLAYTAPELIGGHLDEFITDVQKQVGARVGMITTGPNTGSFL